ncbi:MAG: hypothetical protein MUF76_11560 [Hydrogenophaga sp.]|nr:hypothetical protein [Hydrogenophaga sp.]
MTHPHAHPHPAAAPLGVVVLLALACALPPLTCHAQGTTAQQRSGGAVEKAAVPRSVRFIPAPSHETPAARAKRLKRECKGRPNAGACLGHTR